MYHKWSKMVFHNIWLIIMSTCQVNKITNMIEMAQMKSNFCNDESGVPCTRQKLCSYFDVFVFMQLSITTNRIRYSP